MNKKELISKVAEYAKLNNIRKNIPGHKSVLHISDENGNQTEFKVRHEDKTLAFTNADIEAIIDACTDVITDAVSHGDKVYITSFGALGLKYRAERATKKPMTSEWVKVEARFTPKFTAGKNLKIAARVYEKSLEDRIGLYPDEIAADSEEDDSGDGDR